MDYLSKDPRELGGIINNHFASVCNQMPCQNLSSLPAFRPMLPSPIISTGEIGKNLNKINITKAAHPSDNIPSKIIKGFSFELTEPLTHIFNVLYKRVYSLLYGRNLLLHLFLRYSQQDT